MKQVKVYGPGCKRCDTARQMVIDAGEALGLELDVEKVTDPRAIAMAGVISTPGIAVDGKLVHAGGLPDETKLKNWLSA